jgi:polyhydroxyalkanoate synthesis repressor PhaR
MLIVKKYSNRRLYDTAKSRYITLEDLALLIRQGTDVSVLDAHSGDDLTQQILTQIILESRGGARLLPTKLLVRLIRMEDEALAEFFGRYVSWALEMYTQARTSARTLMPLNPLATAPFAATDALARFVLGSSPWRGGQAGQSPMPAPTGRAPEPEPDMPPAPPSSVDEELAARQTPSEHAVNLAQDVSEQMARLRSEIEALKQSIGGPARAKKPKKKAARKR